MSLLPSTRYHNTRWEMHPDFLNLHAPFRHSVGNVRPWSNPGDHIAKNSHIGPDGFQMSLDVQHFLPSEITVKTVEDFIEIEAIHEDREDEHGNISRHFRRRYRLPDGFKAEDVVSDYSSDGILTVKVPPVAPELKGRKVRHVPILLSGPMRLNECDRKDVADEKAAEGIEKI